MLIGVIVSPGLRMAAVVVTGLEEAVLRCTMVQRDRAMFVGYERNAKQEKVWKKIWAISITSSMVAEVYAIILSRLMYLFFRPHRYIFNVGYGAGDEAIADAGLILLSIVIEIALEVVVDAAALEVEAGHGVDLDEFWKLWNGSECLHCPK